MGHGLKSEVLRTGIKYSSFYCQFQSLKDYSVKEYQVSSGQVIKYVESEQVESRIKKLEKEDTSTKLGSALDNNSDLVPNVYEGKRYLQNCRQN